MKWTVVYIAEAEISGSEYPEDNQPAIWRVSSKRFDSKQDAQEYANGIAKSRLAFVAYLGGVQG